jgi:hypothetical protein
MCSKSRAIKSCLNMRKNATDEEKKFFLKKEIKANAALNRGD